jgi:hypothetical protein
VDWYSLPVFKKLVLYSDAPYKAMLILKGWETLIFDIKKGTNFLCLCGLAMNKKLLSDMFTNRDPYKSRVTEALLTIPILCDWLMFSSVVGPSLAAGKMCKK